MRKILVQGIVKNQVSWQKRLRMLGYTEPADFFSTAGQSFTRRLQENMPHKAAAIKARFWRGTSIFVACAGKTERVNSQLVHGRVGLGMGLATGQVLASAKGQKRKKDKYSAHHWNLRKAPLLVKGIINADE